MLAGLCLAGPDIPIVVVPWLGYATWHAYRDTLVPQPAQSVEADNSI